MLRRSTFSRFRASTVVRRAGQPPAYFAEFAANLTASIDKKLEEMKEMTAKESAAIASLEAGQKELKAGQETLSTKIDGLNQFIHASETYKKMFHGAGVFVVLCAAYLHLAI